MNTQLYVGVGILTVQELSHAVFTVQPVLLRYTSGLAQSLFLTTPISLTRRCRLSPTLAAPSFSFWAAARGRPPPYVNILIG